MWNLIWSSTSNELWFTLHKWKKNTLLISDTDNRTWSIHLLSVAMSHVSMRLLMFSFVSNGNAMSNINTFTESSFELVEALRVTRVNTIESFGEWWFHAFAYIKVPIPNELCNVTDIYTCFFCIFCVPRAFGVGGSICEDWLCLSLEQVQRIANILRLFFILLLILNKRFVDSGLVRK